jgi:NADH-quinone oxidoreductase subunit E
VIQVNDDFFEDLDGPRATALLEALRRGDYPKPGPTIDRLTSAPVGGRDTLLEG